MDGDLYTTVSVPAGGTTVVIAPTTGTSSQPISGHSEPRPTGRPV